MQTKAGRPLVDLKSSYERDGWIEYPYRLSGSTLELLHERIASISLQVKSFGGEYFHLAGHIRTPAEDMLARRPDGSAGGGSPTAIRPGDVCLPWTDRGNYQE